VFRKYDLHLLYKEALPTKIGRRDCSRMFGWSQSCGAGTQIWGSGSRHLNYLALARTSRNFWLRLQNNLVKKT